MVSRKLKAAMTAAVVLLPVLYFHACGDEKENDPERARIFTQVKKLLEDSDSYKAVEFMSMQGDPLEVSRRFSDLVNDFYWKEKDLPRVVTFATAGIHYSLIKSQELIASDLLKANEVRDAARVISYNLASYTWPGWNEEGIVITGSDLVAGLEAARLNLRLTKELELGLMPRSTANWGLGAIYMALERYDEAISAFESSMEDALLDDAREFELMNLGYIGIAKVLKGSTGGEGQSQLDKAMAELEKLDTEDAGYFLAQLKTALEVFTRD